MTTKKLSTMSKVMVGAALVLGVAVASSANAQSAGTTYTSPSGTVYSVPAGYSAYSTGTYYDSATGMYYDPVTGQSSTQAPAGPASMTNGAYNIPAGYNASLYGTYYNPTTLTYYDPATGFYSTTMPLGPDGGVATSGTVTATSPTLPDTGAGGNADVNLAILAAAAVVALGGVAVLSKKAAATR